MNWGAQPKRALIHRQDPCGSSQTGKVFESAKYDFIVSPFVSVRERIRDFKCLAYAYQHHEIDKQIQGQKLSTIKAMQTIHNNNLVNKQSGWDITDTFSFNEWGVSRDSIN